MVQQKNPKIMSKILNIAESTCKNLKALIGPIIPMNPNPADSLVPAIPIKLPAIPEIPAVIRIGNIIIGYFTMLGIIIFTPPKNIEIGTATRFTLLVPISNTASVAEIPIDAEPAARPVIPIAMAIATVDNGEIIIKLKTIEISIHINTGCSSVKLLTILPMPVVIICTYGNISTPIVADKPPTIVGYTISAMLPTRFQLIK